MARYRKKSVIIEAFQYGIDEPPHWFMDSPAVLLGEHGTVIIRILEGDHTANPADFIIQGIQHELYPCKADIFRATYDAVEE